MKLYNETSVLKKLSFFIFQEKVDVKFTKLQTDGIALVAQLKQGGKFRTEAQNCRLKARSDLKARLTNIKDSFRTCSGVPNF